MFKFGDKAFHEFNYRPCIFTIALKKLMSIVVPHEKDPRSNYEYRGQHAYIEECKAPDIILSHGILNAPNLQH